MYEPKIDKKKQMEMEKLREKASKENQALRD